MPENRTVTVTLKITGDPAESQKVIRAVVGQAESAVRAGQKAVSGSVGDVKAVATRAAENVNQAHKAAADSARYSTNSRDKELFLRGAAAEPRHGGLSGLGGLSGAKVGGALAVAAVAYKAIDTTTNAIRIAGEKYLTHEQKSRELFKSLPGGETLTRWADNVTGREVKMQEVEFNRQRFAATRQGYQERTAFDIHTSPLLAGLNERAQQTAARGAIMGPNVNRTTAEGELEFRQKSRLLPVVRDLRKAEIEQSTATKERASAQSEVNRLTDQEHNITKQRMNLIREMEKNTGSGPVRQQMLANLEDMNKQLEANQRNKQAAAGQLFETSQREAEAKRTAANVRAAFTEAQAANLEEQVQTSAGGARRVGGMNPFDRAFGVQAVKAVQKFGPDSIPPEMLAMAAQAAPETIGKILETHGAKTDAFKELQRIAPADFGPAGQSPEQLRQAAQGARNQAEVQRVSGDQEFTRTAAESGKEMARINIEAFRVLMAAYKLEIETNIRIGKGQQ